MAASTLTATTLHSVIDGFGISRADTDFGPNTNDLSGTNWLAWESKAVSATTAVAAAFTLSGTDDGLCGVVTYKRSGTVAIVQTNGTFYNGVILGSDFPVGFNSAVAATNMLWLVVVFFQNMAGVGTVTCSDDVNGSWNQDFAADLPSTDGSMYVFSFPNTAAGSPTIKLHTSNTLTSKDTTVQIAEFSNITTTTPFDKSHSTAFTGSSTPASGSTATLAQANEWVIGFCGLFNGHAYTLGAGYTNLFQGPDGAGTGRIDYGLTTTIADQLFTTTSGIGLTILRLGINSGSTTVPQSTAPVSINQFLARVPTGKIFAVTWSPPATWKASGTVPTYSALASGHYTDFSNWLGTFCTNFHTSYGVYPYAVSVQNEPDFDPSGAAGACSYTNAQMHTFMQTHGANWITLGLNGTVKIALPEQSGWAFDRAAATWSDGTTSAYTSMIPAHNYSGSIANPAGPSGAAIWSTEYAHVDAYDGTITDGLRCAVDWHNIITTSPDAANVAILYWQVTHPADSDNEGIMKVDGTLPKRYYVLGNWSKYVRPAYQRIDATYTGGDGNSLITAYKSTTKLTIVCVRNAASTETINFTLSSFTTVPVDMQQYQTDATHNLANTADLFLTGNTFSITLPASSVVTLDGVLPAPPTFARAVLPILKFVGGM